MTRACYDPSTDTIRTDLAPDACPAQVHAGPEGRSVVLHLSRTEATHLMNQLVEAIRRSERVKPGRGWSSLTGPDAPHGGPRPTRTDFTRGTTDSPGDPPDPRISVETLALPPVARNNGTADETTLARSP
jgi:hypothetical protein